MAYKNTSYYRIKVNILLKEMKKSVLKIECLVLLLQGWLDSDINPYSMDEIFNRINSKNKRKIWLETNNHSILNSPNHQRIFSELIKVISEICN
ncbi:MAG: hypothetical protein ACW98D_03225 [Promethearchaeota archaeon]|jgi:esterase/lipase